MLDRVNTVSQVLTFREPDDITLGELRGFLQLHASMPLVFSYDGTTIRPGYHVTEVKAGQFAALDCGGNPEAWPEIFVQLWDIEEDDRTHMLAGKFVAIITKVIEHVGLDDSAKLTFEVSDGVAPMQLHRAAKPEVSDGVIKVSLTPRPASCKPRDRWLEEQKAGGSCCGPSASSGRCG